MVVRTDLKAGQLPEIPHPAPGADMSYNLQYLQLQDQMQNDNRQYTAVSNIMRDKHDTVANAIANIR